MLLSQSAFLARQKQWLSWEMNSLVRSVLGLEKQVLGHRVLIRLYWNCTPVLYFELVLVQSSEPVSSSWAPCTGGLLNPGVSCLPLLNTE